MIEVLSNFNGIEGLCIITPKVFGDNRGYFMETYNAVSYTHLTLPTKRIV